MNKLNYKMEKNKIISNLLHSFCYRNVKKNPTNKQQQKKKNPEDKTAETETRLGK